MPFIPTERYIVKKKNDIKADMLTIIPDLSLNLFWKYEAKVLALYFSDSILNLAAIKCHDRNIPNKRPIGIHISSAPLV